MKPSKSKDQLKFSNGTKKRKKKMMKQFTHIIRNGHQLLLILTRFSNQMPLKVSQIQKLMNGHANQRLSITLQLILDRWYYLMVRLTELINSNLLI
jgi:hypothetical protein